MLSSYAVRGEFVLNYGAARYYPRKMDAGELTKENITTFVLPGDKSRDVYN